MNSNLIKLINEINEDPYEIIPTLSKKKLVDVINLANDCYRKSDKELMTDAVYDLLKDQLEEIDPNNKIFNNIGHEIHTKNKVKLPFFMGSMDR